MLEGYSKIDLLFEDSEFKESIKEHIVNYDNKFGLPITHVDGIKIKDHRYFELDRTKLIGCLLKDDIKKIDIDIYIRKEYKSCLLPDVVKVHVVCFNYRIIE